ncbi:MAG: YlxR family protein, partial [Desulfuromonadales bacterium]|nr:YlxR family protein [Desulfuromonadales bacterium]
MGVAEKSAQRTCIACRETKDKDQLLRYVVAPDGVVLVDYRQRLP